MKVVLNNFYYFGICHFCKSTTPQLQRCSACKSIAYCSKEHQKQDWQNHRELCKVISFTIVNDVECTSNWSYEEWTDYRLSIQQKWVSLLKRPLEPFECQMWMFPRACNWCYSKSNLTDCVQCCNTTYCCHEHREFDKHNHRKHCNALRLSMNIDRYLLKFKSYPEIDLRHLINNLIEIPKDMTQFLNLVYEQTEGTEEIRIQRSLISEAMSLGAILLYAIEKLSLNRADKNKFVLHLVGAAAPESTADWLLCSELLFHAFDNISEISFNLIGPEVWESFENFSLCQACGLKDKKVCFNIYKSLYHDVVTDIEKADFVIALNCGLHEFEGKDCDEWNLSIPFMITDIPFIYTSYTEEEMFRDLEYIKKIIPNFDDMYLSMCEKNPFSSLRPLRDWCSKDFPVFYSNCYIAMIKKT